ncbi:MAG: redoxin domain-containing protein, partial [bacterium]|nr:redoxin domain-containing protein [bacterium]
EARPVKFSDYEGQWLAVIFYPADFTFVCPTELAETADLYDQFKDEGAEILSVSTDTHFVHKAWHDTSPMVKKIKFPMLADPTGKLSRAFGTYIEAAGVALRGTFLIDPDGIVKHFEMNDLNIGRSGKELLRKLRAAKYVREHDGEVCPAGWEPGTETIAPNLDMVGKI